MPLTYKDAETMWHNFKGKLFIIHGPDVRMLGRIVDFGLHNDGIQDVVDFLKVEEIEKPMYLIGQANTEVKVIGTYYLRPGGITYLKEYE